MILSCFIYEMAEDVNWRLTPGQDGASSIVVEPLDRTEVFGIDGFAEYFETAEAVQAVLFRSFRVGREMRMRTFPLLDICFSFLYNPYPSCDGKRQNTKPLEEGLMEEARALGEMNANMVQLGFLIILVCQDIVTVRAFKRSVREGLLCAVVPGYILFHASREESRQVKKSLIGWLVGLGVMLMGFMR